MDSKTTASNRFQQIGRTLWEFLNNHFARREQLPKTWLFVLPILLLTVNVRAQVYIDYMIRADDLYADVSAESGDEEPTWRIRCQVGATYNVNNYSDWECIYIDGEFSGGALWSRTTEILWTGTCLDNADNIWIGIEGWEDDGIRCTYTSEYDDDYSSDAYDYDYDMSANLRDAWSLWRNNDGDDIFVNCGSAGSDGYYYVEIDVYWEYSVPVNPSFSIGTVAETSFRITKTSNNNYRITDWDYQVSTNSTFTNVVSDGTEITGSYVDVSDLEPGTTYYVRIRGENEAGTGGYTSYQTEQTDNATVTFTDGSSFTPDITQGENDQALGRWSLSANVAGSSLNAATIKLNGTRTGASNFKLWYSSNATFEAGSDTQLGSTVAADPGTGNTVNFSGFSNGIGTSAAYYFLTCDVASDATGTIQGIIVENSNLGLDKGTLSGSISNASLSGDEVPLPVMISAFTANLSGKVAILEWTTATETGLIGFELYRRNGQQSEWDIIASYIDVPELCAQSGGVFGGDYSYIDESVGLTAPINYLLAGIGVSGQRLCETETELTMDIAVEYEEVVPTKFTLFPAYPNPFNPTTTIKFALPENQHVRIRIFNINGKQVTELVNKSMNAGVHRVEWNAQNASSGLYFIRMETDKFQSKEKCLLVR